MGMPAAVLSAYFFSLTQPIHLGMGIARLPSLFLLILPAGTASPKLLFFCLPNSYGSLKTQLDSSCLCLPATLNCSLNCIPIVL